jgi:stage V sporulation protein D (sporulation-specific penicillin-binding protein)
MALQHRNDYSLVKRRLEVVFLLFLVSTALLVLRLGYLQWFQGREFLKVASRLQVRTFHIDAKRGKIRDRNGNELAQDIMTKAVVLNPRVVKDKALTAARLGELLGMSDTEQVALRDKMLRAHERRNFYMQVHRGVERKLAERLLKLSRTEPALKGIWLEDAPTRVNPSGRDGIQLVGSVSTDRRGVDGIELKLDGILRGRDGERRVHVNGAGDPIPQSETRMVDPVDGKDIRLTIDRDIQHFVEAELEKVAREQMPDGASAIVMDVKTGEILGMGNWPTFHPKDKKIAQDQRRNRAVTDLFEPGSIFKVITAAAALENGVKTDVYCSGSRAIGNRSVRCAHGSSHGQCDLRRMVEQSCNIAAGTLAERVGPTRLYQFLDNFGFQSKTGIEFGGEEYGRMLPPDDWRMMRTVNIGFGQGIVATPIQIVSAYAAIANDGLYNPPRLVLDAAGADLPERKPRRVLSPQHAATVRQCMEAVVTGGTGKSAKIAGYSVGGKTGTAQIAKNGRYGHGYVASFVGIVPVSRPRLAILVSVWHPRRGQYGGVVSAPVFREVARQSVAYLKIEPDAPSDLRDGSNRATFTRYAQTNGTAGGHDND